MKILKNWADIPKMLKNDDTLYYYKILATKKNQLLIKRLLDIIFSLILILILSPIMIITFILIKLDSKGPAIYKQKRVTIYGKIFNIYKFRTMRIDADKNGINITVKEDSRITRLGKFLRKYRIDEFPQLFNILLGDLSFVGTRPEVEKYVEKYSDTMKATLLMPSGVTSMTSVAFRNEDELLKKFADDFSCDIETAYIKYILPAKMQINLDYIKNFSLYNDFRIILITVLIIFKIRRSY